MFPRQYSYTLEEFLLPLEVWSKSGSWGSLPISHLEHKWSVHDTPVQYYWGQLQGAMTKLRDKGTVDMEKKCSFSATTKSSYFKAMPRKDENISKIQRSRTVASHDASFVPQSSWLLPHHCVVTPVLHSCCSITCVVTVSLGKMHPKENTCQQDKVLLKDLTAHDVFVLTRPPSSLILVASSCLFN